MTAKELLGSAIGVAIATAATGLGLAWLVAPHVPVSPGTVVAIGLIYATVEVVRIAVTRRMWRQNPRDS